MERWIKFITVLCILGAFHLSLSRSVPLPNSDERAVHDPFHPKGGEEGPFFEGDIRLKPGDDPYNSRKRFHKTKRMIEDTIVEKTPSSGDGSGDEPLADHTWPDGVIPFMFPQTLSSDYRMLYEEAIQRWQEVTCIQFVAKDNTHEDYLLLAHSEEYGCSSFIGRKHGRQLVSMSSKCASVGHAIHELGHAIGMWHEHSRPDRDMYIRVNYDNIIETERDNFGIMSQEEFAKIPDVGYDVESIMHYGEFAFSKDGSRTIEIPEDTLIEDCESRLPMGQRHSLSYVDKKRANKLYRCTSHLSTLQAPSCEKLQPTPSLTVPTKTATAMPTPTITQPPSTPTSTRLKSGNVLTFQYTTGEGKPKYGMHCTPSPGCTPNECIEIFGTSSCSIIEHQFAIYSPSSKKIKSGNIVVLRSVLKPTTWLDCSSPTGGCTISQCTDNSADAFNTSYISDCEDHQFKIVGVTRPLGKLLKSENKVKLKHPVDDTYLNCSGKKCELGEPQIFELNKLRE